MPKLGDDAGDIFDLAGIEINIRMLLQVDKSLHSLFFERAGVARAGEYAVYVCLVVHGG